MDIAGHNAAAMDIFILLMIGRFGLTSLYELKEKAGLQPGGIRASLGQLEKSGWVVRARPAKRMRRELSLTEEGKELLNRSWANILHDHAEPESVLRAAFVALAMAGPGPAAEYLEQTGATRRTKAEKDFLQAKYLEQSKTDPLSAYGWMRVLSEAHRRGAESKAFLSISQSMKGQSIPDARHDAHEHS